MSDLNYDPKKLSFNEHDQVFLADMLDTIYKKLAEVVLAQNIRFFSEQEKQNVKICELTQVTDDHEKRLLILEKERLKKMVKKLGIAVGALLIIGTLMALIII